MIRATRLFRFFDRSDRRSVDTRPACGSKAAPLAKRSGIADFGGVLPPVLGPNPQRVIRTLPRGTLVTGLPRGQVEGVASADPKEIAAAATGALISQMP